MALKRLKGRSAQACLRVSRRDPEKHHESTCTKHCTPSCAGPEKMVESVAMACSTRNDKLGLCGTPYLGVKKYTYSL